MNINLDFNSFIKAYDREAIISTAQSLLLIATRSAALAAIFDATPELKTARSVISGIQIGFTLHSTFTSFEKIYETFKKKGVKGSERLIGALETAAATIRISTGAIGITRTLSSFKLFDLEVLSSSLGNIPVAQTLGHASSILSIVTLSIQISIDSIKIYERSKKIDKLKDKAILWTQPLDLNLVQKKITKRTEEHDALVSKTEALSNEVLDIQSQKATATAKYREQKTRHKQKKGFGRLMSWQKLRSKKRSVKKLKVKELSLAKTLDQARTCESDSLQELTSWNKIQAKWDHFSDEDNQALAKFQADKTAKWKGRTKSLKIEQIKAGVGLGLKIVGLALAITALVFSMTGFGLVPVLASMAALSLTLAVTNLGFALFRRHTSQKIMKEVPVPVLN